MEHAELARIYSKGSEAAVLGSMLVDAKCADGVFAILDADSFYLPEHKIIFEALETLSAANTAIDAVMLRDQLVKTGQLDSIGGVNYIAELMDSVPSSANAAYYANVVRERQRYRNVIQAVTDIRCLLDDSLSVGDLIEKVQERVLALEPAVVDSGVYDVADHAEQAVLALRDRNVCLPTGFRDIDYLIGGLTAGDMIIIGGRPSMGKTALATDVSLNIAKTGKEVLYFTFETTASAVMQRAAGNLGSVSIAAAKAQDASTETLEKLADGACMLRKLPIWISETGNTPAKLIANVRKHRRRHGLSLIVIDYLQLMNTGSKRENRQQEVSAISMAIKRLAIEEKVPVLALSQLNRASEGDGKKERKPRMSDLRESGTLEQDADVVLLLYRQDYYRLQENRDAVTDGKAEVSIAKNKNGPPGMAELYFHSEYISFHNERRSHGY
jgi:replicative DNA helicase